MIWLFALLAYTEGPFAPDVSGIPGERSGVHADVDLTGGGEEKLSTVFYAPLDSNDILLPWGTEGLPAAPDVHWFGSDPTGSAGDTTHAFTETGSTTAGNAPFCPVGKYDTLDGGDCAGTRVFDGSDYYVSDTIGDLAQTTGSVVVVAISTTGDKSFISIRNPASANDGWILYHRYVSGTGNQCSMFVDTDSATVEATKTTADLNEWVICGGTFNTAGNVYAYKNGQQGTGVAFPAGDMDAALTTARIGIDPAWGTHFVGEVAWIGVWQNVELSSDQMKSVAAHLMGLYSPTSGSPTLDSSLSNGPICCWIDQKLECFSDDWAPVGCELAPGVTGAGGGDGLLSVETQTNNLLHSRDLSTGWTETGTSVVACSQSSTPFRNAAMTTCKITDDDGAGAEYISQTVDITALATGEFVQVTLYAEADSAQSLDIQVVEQTGASCSTTTTNFTAASVTTSWQQFHFEHTVLDGDCTDLILRIAPVDDITNTASTGHAYVVAQMGIDQNFRDPSPIYCETTTATVSCGDMDVSYTVSNDFDSGPVIVTWNHVNAHDGSSHPEGNEAIRFDGASADFDFRFSTHGRQPVNRWSATQHTYSAITATQGTAYDIRLVLNTAIDLYTFKGSNISGSSTTASGNLGAVSAIDVGSNNGASQGSHIIKRMRVEQ